MWCGDFVPFRVIARPFSGQLGYMPPFEPFTKLGLFGPPYAVRGLTWCRDFVPFRVIAHPFSGQLVYMPLFEPFFHFKSLFSVFYPGATNFIWPLPT